MCKYYKSPIEVPLSSLVLLREALINCLHKQIAALAGAQKLAYLFDISHFLRSIRLALCLLGELFSTSSADQASFDHVQR